MIFVDLQLIQGYDNECHGKKMLLKAKSPGAVESNAQLAGINRLYRI
jgi:hypothetical protein